MQPSAADTHGRCRNVNEPLVVTIEIAPYTKREYALWSQSIKSDGFLFTVAVI